MEKVKLDFGLTEALIDYSSLQEYQLPEFVLHHLSRLKISLSENLDRTRVKQLLFICEILIDYSWEFLNTNLWMFVEDKWRLVYAYATLYKIILLKLDSQVSGDLVDDNLGDRIVKLCDLGLLMSGPLAEKQFDTIIKFLRAHSRPTEKRQLTCEVEGLEEKKRAKVELTTNECFLLKVENSPTIEAFNRDYFKTSTPVIIDGQMIHWPASKKWSIEYLIELAGNRTVPIEIGSKYTDTNWSQKLMTVREFIDEFILSHEKKPTSSRGYLAQHPLFDQIPELKDDIYIPEYCHYLDSSGDIDSTVDINAWFGPGGTVSPLHFDPKPNFLCQVIGEKYVRLYDEKYSDRLYAHQGNILKNTSQIDVENLDASRFPLAKDVPFWEGILRPGQMLFIPPRCWHYIRSLSLSFSVSFWWQAE